MRLVRSCCSFIALLTFSPYLFADYQLNMTRGVTPISQDIYDLHMTIFWICVGIGAIVFGVLIYALIKHRKSKGAVAASFHENTAVEITWSIIPFLILIVMAIPATIVLMRMSDDAHSDLTVKITGYQWKWEYEYLDQGIKYMSNMSTPYSEIENQTPKNKWYLLEVDKPLVLPIHEKVRFLITANDVIHSWWVPDFGVKKDAVPGFINEAWARINKPGIYRGQCAELCGMNHGYMPIVVKAVTKEEFNKWIKQQQEGGFKQATVAGKDMTHEELMKLGKKTYDASCAACHKVDGTGIPPMFPALKGSGIATNKSKDGIRRHLQVVIDGMPGTAMQAFGAQLTDEEIAAVVTYERNAWGNDTGDTVQPKDSFNFRNKKNVTSDKKLVEP